MPVISEAKLNSDIKSGSFSPVYFFYGEEAFLTKTYAERIKNKIIGSQAAVDINLLELNGNPDLSMLSDHIQALPFFADRKVIMINDFNLEKITEEETEAFKDIIKNVPSTSVVVFYLTNCSFSLRSDRVKKIFEFIKNNACVCEFKALNKMKIGELICKKAAKQKRIISRTTAEYLAEITSCDLSLASVETSKLCCYVGEGQEITAELIDLMVAKQLETKVYTLSDNIIAGNRNKALTILDELFEQRAEPVQILSALCTAYSDYYYAKTAKESGIIPQQVASDFGYTGFKASIAARKYNESAKMDIDDLRNGLRIIFEADVKCKSSSIDKRLLLEKTVFELMNMR